MGNRGMVLGLVVAVAGQMTVGRPAAADVICKAKAGAMFVRTACKKKETPVDLATFGAVGPKGDKGDAGTAGAVGPSDAFSKYGPDTGNVVTTTEAVYATLSLAAGKYVIWAKGWVFNSGADIVSCRLVASVDGTETGTFDKDSVQVSQNAGTARSPRRSCSCTTSPRPGWRSSTAPRRLRPDSPASTSPT